MVSSNHTTTTPIYKKGDRIIRMWEITQRSGFSTSQVYKLISEGKCPPLFKIVPGGRASGMLESTFSKWLQSRQETA